MSLEPSPPASPEPGASPADAVVSRHLRAGWWGLAVFVALGAVLYWAMLQVLMPAVARAISRVVVAVARRDFQAVRATLGSLAG